MQQWVKKKREHWGSDQSVSKQRKNSVSRSRQNPGSGELTITSGSCPGTATRTAYQQHLRPDLVHHPLGRVLHSTDSGGYQPKTPPEAQVQAAESKED